MKKFLLVLALILATAAFANAYTANEAGNVVQVTSITEDFTYSSSCMMYGSYGEGREVIAIIVTSGAEYGDYFNIKEATDTGPSIFPPCTFTDTKTDTKVIYLHGVKVRPVIDYSACSLSTGSSVIFLLK